MCAYQSNGGWIAVRAEALDSPAERLCGWRRLVDGGEEGPEGRVVGGGVESAGQKLQSGSLGNYLEPSSRGEGGRTGGW